TSYLQDNAVRTTLNEGLVRISSNKNKAISPVVLLPSQQLTYSPQMAYFEVKKVDTGLYTSWKDGHLIFDNTPFYEVIEQIERKFGVHVKYNSQQLRQYGITVKFIQNQTIDEVLSVLSKIAYFKYELQNDTIYIMK
ncbi:MAG: DUF4974 domain-containing protein, partial [Tannerellaceae bacterium]|nr:DUF4974 domain-containing protein [Tannerellaceae bacterium]